MPATYTLINSNVLTSSTASVTFSSIPSTYTDLVVRMSLRAEDTDPGGDRIKVVLNGNSSSIYSMTNIVGFGSGGYGSAALSSQTYLTLRYTNQGGMTTNAFGSAELYIPSYTVSQNKPMNGMSVQETNSASARMSATAGLFSSTSAITSMEFLPYSGNWLTGSSFYLYGISNA